jgi:hypothetical protein
MTSKSFISKDIGCPWCGAKPGEDCTESSSYPPYVRPIPMGHGHLARVIKKNDASQH